MPPKATASKSKASPQGQNLKGLILRPEHAVKFFHTEVPGVAKTLELRSVRCRCVAKGDRFYIVACQQGKNNSGTSVFKVLGSVVFQGFEEIADGDIPARYMEHFCSEKDFNALSAKWGSKGHCFGWSVSDPLPFKPAKWIASLGQEGWVNFSAENLMDEKDLVGVPGPGSQDVSVSRSIESFFKPAPPPTEDASALPLSTAHGDPEEIGIHDGQSSSPADLEPAARMAECKAVLDVDLRASTSAGFPSISEHIQSQAEIDLEKAVAEASASKEQGPENLDSELPLERALSDEVKRALGEAESVKDNPDKIQLGPHDSHQSGQGQCHPEVTQAEEIAVASPFRRVERPVDTVHLQSGGAETASAAADSSLSSMGEKPTEPQPTQPRKPQAPKLACSSLEDAFAFWDNCFDVLTHGHSEEEGRELLEQLAHNLEHDTLSTAFSGICAPETAANVLRFRLGHALGRPIELSKDAKGFSHMIEWNSQSQEECKLLAEETGSCLFGDIGQFYRKEIRENILPELKAKPHTIVQALKPLILTGKSVTTSGYCLIHNKICHLKTCSRHIAGSSCKPFSKRGTLLGTADGEILFTMAWFGLRRTLQEADLTMENVKDFPVSLASEMLSDLYYISDLILCPTSLGAPTARPRQFLRMRHKGKILAEASPISRFAKRFFRAVKFHWVEYYYLHKEPNLELAGTLLPAPNELEQELKWAQSRPLSRAYGLSELNFKEDDNAFLKALNFGEESFRLSYALTHPNQAWQLNQNPESGFGAASTDHCFPTVVANAHMLFTEKIVPARWIMGSEALATQGFPIIPFLWNIHPEQFPKLCSFNKPRPDRTSRHLLTQAGNSMNVYVMTLMMLHGLVEWQRKPLPGLFQDIRSSRILTRVDKRARNFEDPMPPQKRLRAKTHLEP